MKPSIALIAALLALLTASFSAQAQIYQYKDASGKTVISDRPPPGGTSKVRTVAGEASTESPSTAASAASAPKTTADRELEFKKRAQAQKEANDKAQKEAADKAARKEDCERARRQLEMLESGERMTTRDEKGERVFIEDSTRAAEIDRTRKFVAETCK
ncbi:MAG: DUF4124 domain-containing protein [Rhodocyclaceae bacterium]